MHFTAPTLLRHECSQALVATQARQREAQRLEEAAGGKYKLHVGEASALPAELDKARRKQERVRGVVAGLAEAQAELAPALRRVLAHAAAV